MKFFNDFRRGERLWRGLTEFESMDSLPSTSAISSASSTTGGGGGGGDGDMCDRLSRQLSLMSSAAANDDDDNVENAEEKAKLIAQVLYANETSASPNEE
jgi:hypothetical protein